MQLLAAIYVILATSVLVYILITGALASLRLSTAIDELQQEVALLREEVKQLSK